MTPNSRWANKQTQDRQKTKHSKSWVIQTKEMKGIQGQSEWMDDPHDRTIAEMNRRTNERNKAGTQNSSTDWQKIKPCKILKLFNLGQFGLE